MKFAGAIVPDRSSDELGTMGTTITRSNVGPSDEVLATGVLEHLSATRKRKRSYEPGTLEVVRLLREVHRSELDAPEVEVVFAARPASKRSLVNSVHFNFSSADTNLPVPTLDEVNATIHLYYPKTQLASVMEALRSRRDRFCYFWRAADGTQMRAWLFTPK